MKDLGQRSSQATRSSICGHDCARVARCRSRRSALTSRMRVAPRQRVELRQFVEHDRGHRTRARAKLEDLAATQSRQHLGALPRDATAEDRRHLGCRDEVARRAELLRAGAVVAETRLVERELHEPRESDPAAVRLDLGADPILERAAVRRFVGGERGQIVAACSRSGARAGDSLRRVGYLRRPPRVVGAAGRIRRMHAERPLDGHCILVTGAARRLGAAIARRLHAAGASVVVHHRRSAAEATALAAELNAARPGSAITAACDLKDLDALPALVESALQRFGRLDVLVNNASTFYPTPVGSITAAEWDDLLGSKSARAALPVAGRRTGAAHGARTDPQHARHPWHAAAARAPGLQRCEGRVSRCSPARSRASSVPRSASTALRPVRCCGPRADFPTLLKHEIIGKTALKRMGTPEDVARAALYLAADAPYVTGQILVVDGGRSL